MRMAMLSITLVWAWNVNAQDRPVSYPNRAAIDEYLMERNAELTLARSAAPPSIAGNAEILFLGRHGYETAAKGKNGFVCMVERSWTAGIDDPEFWNPKLRAPICFNPAAARSYLPITIKKTEWVLAGQSKDEIAASVKAAFRHNQLPAPEPGAMSYMLSKHQYLSDHDPCWHPHLMFFAARSDALTWGANLPSSPVMASDDALDGLTVFIIPVARWSDGTTDTNKQ